MIDVLPIQNYCHGAEALLRRFLLLLTVTGCVLGLSTLAAPEAAAQDDKDESDAEDDDDDDKPFGWVQIFTNYEAVVTIDGEPYPKRSENGMRVTADERHSVNVKMGDKEKSYTIVVKPLELRTLLVDLSGYQTPPSPGASGPTTRKDRPKATKDEDASGETGKLTVYSKPKGEVYVDGGALGVSTPMINRELDIGRHEVQVKWESGDMSEVKTIRIRKGSKLKLFFRDRNNKLGKN